MRRCFAVAILLVVGLVMGGLSQTTVLIHDEFTELGPIDIYSNPTWTHVDLFLNGGNLGVLPAVIPGDGDHGGVLHFLCGSGRQALGALYETTTFAPDEILLLSLDAQRLSVDSILNVSIGYKQPGLANGRFGSTTSTPASIVWALPGIGYYPGPYSYSTPMYPLEGFGVQIPYTTVVPTADRIYAHTHTDLLVPMQVGAWCSLRLITSASAFQFAVNGQTLFETPYSYYGFDQYDDWMLLLGDQGSGGGTNISVNLDNVLLVRTRSSILQVVDTFGVSFPVADVLYATYGPDKLEQCLACCSDSFEAFLECLDPPEEAECRLRILDAQLEDKLTVRVANVGSAPCSGIPILIAGLSYDMTWVPEWETHFFEQSFPEVSLLPGQTMILEATLPAIPQEAREALTDRIQSVWTGYVDREPAQDYVGLIITMGESLPAFGFVPWLE